MSQPKYASPVAVDAAASLAEAGMLIMARALPRVVVLRNGARVGTLGLCDVTRGLRRAPAFRTASDVMVDSDAAADDPPAGADAADDPPVSEPGGLFQPDLLLSSQYHDRVRRSAEFQPERRLMVAVLEQGVNDYVKHLAPRDALEAELWRDAAAWIENDDTSWLYSFQRICDTLGIAADYLRRGLHAARARVRGPVREEAPEPAPEPDEKRASAGSG